jgi:hypothetical protein
MNGKGKLIGWTVVIIMWSTLLIVGNFYAQKAAIHNRAVQESINTAEDMIEWIVEDVANNYTDSMIADTYIDNLEIVITDLRNE